MFQLFMKNRAKNQMPAMLYWMEQTLVNNMRNSHFPDLGYA